MMHKLSSLSFKNWLAWLFQIKKKLRKRISKQKMINEKQRYYFCSVKWIRELTSKYYFRNIDYISLT